MTDPIGQDASIVCGLSRAAGPCAKATREERPTALRLKLQLVEGSERLPAQQHQAQETLRGKLRTLQAHNSQLVALLTEVCAQLVSISSEDTAIFVTFQTFEEIWKFTTYHTHGFLGRCLESLLLEESWWLGCVDTRLGIEVSLDESSLDLLYRSILMQEGSLFAACSRSQMFDSSTSGGDLFLERGEVAQFEPPFLGSGWSVLRLDDGTRGTAPHAATHPVPPFHQWFLKSCPEKVLLGGGKPASDFPLQFATGSVVVTEAYQAQAPDQLSVAPADCITIVGRLASCFHWFLGQKEDTKEVGLVKTSAVAPSSSCRAADVLLEGEEEMFIHQLETQLPQQAAAALEPTSQHRTAHTYQLDILAQGDSDEEVVYPPPNTAAAPSELKQSLQSLLQLSSCLQSAEGSGEDSPQQEALCFGVEPLSETDSGAGAGSECVLRLLSALEGRGFREELGLLYEQSPQHLLSSTFSGHAHEDQLMAFLAVARESARKKCLLWPQTRLCFLLGKLCAGRSKFSQARVYLEEALSVPHQSFGDLRLLTSIYWELAGTYQLQGNAGAFFGVSERLAALLMALPSCWRRSRSSQGAAVLHFVLKKALLSGGRAAEARACHLLAAAEGVRALPYLERLLALRGEAEGAAWSLCPRRHLLLLGRLYAQLGLPRLSMAAAAAADRQPHAAALRHNLSSLLLASRALGALQGEGQGDGPLSAALAPYLQRCLSSPELQEGGGGAGREALRRQLTLCLSQLLVEHRMLEAAIQLMQTLMDGGPPPATGAAAAAAAPCSERKSGLVWLAWLHINNQQPAAALHIVEAELASLPQHCTSPQEGLLLNLQGVALRCLGNLRRAAESYQASADICQEYEDLANWAVVQANQGLLCLRAGARRLAERRLSAAVRLFSQLEEEEAGEQENFIAVLLQLGHLHLQLQQLHYGKACCEWALLLAIRSHLPHCQLRASSRLCRVYERQSLDAAQTLSYRKHQLLLLSDRPHALPLQAHVLQAAAHIYLSLGTHRAYRAALDYTKSSLGIFIDLGCKQKEARGWLQAANIYQLLGQTELVDLYLQAALDVALSTGESSFILELLEAAGDVFFNSSCEPAKALTFYRERALPLAERSGNAGCRLRLLHKLSQLLLTLQLHQEALPHALSAVEASIVLGDELSERVCYHRLAVLHASLQNFDLVEFFFLKALALCPAPLQFDEESFYYAQVYKRLGHLMFYELKDPFDAANYYHLALAAAMDLGSKKLQLQLCTQLATIYHNFLLDRELSLFFYQKARGFAAELNVRRIDISAHRTVTGSLGRPAPRTEALPRRIFDLHAD